MTLQAPNNASQPWKDRIENLKCDVIEKQGQHLGQFFKPVQDYKTEDSTQQGSFTEELSTVESGSRVLVAVVNSSKSDSLHEIIDIIKESAGDDNEEIYKLVKEMEPIANQLIQEFQDKLNLHETITTLLKERKDMGSYPDREALVAWKKKVTDSKSELCQTAADIIDLAFKDVTTIIENADESVQDRLASIWLAFTDEFRTIWGEQTAEVIADIETSFKAKHKEPISRILLPLMTAIASLFCVMWKFNGLFFSIWKR